LISRTQFAPQVGDVDNNLNRADAVLSRANPQGLDLLVLPELAFTGESSGAIFPFFLSLVTLGEILPILSRSEIQ